MTTERRAPTTAKVQAMINASLPDIRTGQSTGAKKTVVQVNFNPQFASLPSVVLTPYNGMNVWLEEVTSTYFKWSNSSPSQDVMIDWIAIG